LVRLAGTQPVNSTDRVRPAQSASQSPFTGPTGGTVEDISSPSPDRVLRVDLPAALVDRLDAAIASGLVGPSRKAVIASSLATQLDRVGAPTPDIQNPLGDGRPIAELARVSVTACSVFNDGDALVPDEALRGMHVRDFPSIWAAGLLTQMCQSGPVPWDRAVRALTDAAWELSDSIGNRRSPDGTKIAAQLPSNRVKRASAEQAFRDFTIGKLVDRGETIEGAGPFFTWKLAQIKLTEEQVLVAPTTACVELLHSVAGITLAFPHTEASARAFFRHLQQHARADWGALAETLRLAHAQPTRAQMLQAFRRARAWWTAAEVSTNVAGYVARCREWGLIEPKLIDGTYRTTTLGNAMLEDALRAVARP